MLNFDTKRDAIQRLEASVERYNCLAPTVVAEAVDLHQLRKDISHTVIQEAEAYVNVLANSPKEFNKIVAEFRISVDRFDHVVADQKAESIAADMRSGVMAGASVGAGVATAAAAPAAAMAIATTFGTASTGTAIASLSGAAAANAALAWLGGGALVAGGGGMAAGGKVLAVLGGPVGWGIGGLMLAGTAYWTHQKNAEIADEAHQKSVGIEAKIRGLTAAQAEIRALKVNTREHGEGAIRQLRWLRAEAPPDYGSFTLVQKQELGALINNVRSLSQLLNQQVQG
jgi:hypothetical protein